MAGVTSRTLRHYDATGVLRPVGVGTGGVRWYGRAELVRLQEVLVLRELGLGLDAIRTVVDGTTDRAEALARHRTVLSVEREHLDAVIATVERTIADLEGEADMAAEELFLGFDPQRQKAYEQDLVDDWGVSPAAMKRSKTAVRAMGPEDIAANEAQRAEIEAALLALMRAGAPPEDPRVLEALQPHWRLTGRYWGEAPSAEAYSGLGEMYVQHPDFKARYDAMADGFAEWLSTAMTAYALGSGH